MNNVTQQLFKQLETEFSSFDAKAEDLMVRYVKSRVDVLNAAKAEFAHIRRSNVCGYYENLYAAVGGKTIYNLIRSGFNTIVEDAVRKSEKTKAARRNAKIAKKLIDSDITEIVKADVVRSSDGFNGTFEVNTKSGSKKVVVDTIIAGGYNIQCAHYRVLVKVI